MATTAGTPNLFTFSMWRPRLSQPFATAATFSLPEVFLGHAAMHLQRAHGRDDDRRSRLQPGLAALDVEELLGAEIGAEAGFGDDVIGELQRASWWRSTELQPCAMLANGPPWTKAGLFSSVCTRFGCIASLQQHGHRAVGLEVAGVDRLLVARVADDDVAEALARDP